MSAKYKNILHDSSASTTTTSISFNFDTLCLKGDFKSPQFKFDKQQQERLFISICNSEKLTFKKLSWLLSLEIFEELEVSTNFSIFESLCKHEKFGTLQLLYGCVGPHITLSKYRQQQFFINMCWSFGVNIPRILSWLLSLKMFKDVDIHASNDLTFRSACKRGCIDVVKWFLGLQGEQKINKDATNSEGFLYACKNGHYEVVKCLLELTDDRRIDRELVNEGFIGACNNNAINTAELLLSLNCERRINDCDVIGGVLKSVCFQGYEELVNLLLSLVNDQRISDSVVIGEALLCACKEGHLEVVKMLMQLKQDQKINNNDVINMAFQFACEWQNVDIVRKIMSLGE